MGAEFARQLATLGYNLVLVARRREKLELLAGEIRELNLEWKWKYCRLTFPLMLESLQSKDGSKAFTDLEMLVNNAGFGIPGGFIATEINVIHDHALGACVGSCAVFTGCITRQ